MHVAAHSHHLWPDASFDAHTRAWNDAMRLADRKWDYIFGELWQKAQRHVARILHLSDPSSVTFASSTHDFLVRILSCLGDEPRILTTDAEFHSAKRQFDRLEEEGLVEIVRVSQEPFHTFTERWVTASKSGAWDLVFLSHVSFRSGFVANLAEVLAPFMGDAPGAGPVVVVDGYHGFCAVETDFRAFEQRAFYVAGGYKYAMSGEGCCFLHAPPGYGERPRITGWFASFGALAASGDGAVPYGVDGSRFLGATFDPTAIYRFVGVMDWLAATGLSIAQIRAHRTHLSRRFVDGLAKSELGLRAEQLLLAADDETRGAFLTFAFETDGAANSAYERLLARNVITDVRGNRLRVCFSLYHDESDVTRLLGMRATP